MRGVSAACNFWDLRKVQSEPSQYTLKAIARIWDSFFLNSKTATYITVLRKPDETKTRLTQTVFWWGNNNTTEMWVKLLWQKAFWVIGQWLYNLTLEKSVLSPKPPGFTYKHTVGFFIKILPTPPVKLNKISGIFTFTCLYSYMS